MSQTDRPTRWLLLIHQIPPKPDYLRVKIGRRLQRVGAVPVKNSVYVLPDGDQAYEDFQWLRTEIIDGGGDASICRADFVDGLTADQLRHMFRTARNEDYAEIAAAARDLSASLRRRDRDPRARPAKPDDDLARLRKRLTTVAAIDFFNAPERAMAEEALDIAEAEMRPEAETATSAVRVDRAGYRGRTWVTRAGIFVDRMASAWLIRRFIDVDARFKFVQDETYRPAKGELRFDMFEGEFTHDGDRCTFETLLSRFTLDELPLGALAEVVHDIDLKDGKFARDDATGVERVIAAIAAANPNDSARLERGFQLFDELYALFSTEARTPELPVTDER
jgi:hypothetical protein